MVQFKDLFYSPNNDRNTCPCELKRICSRRDKCLISLKSHLQVLFATIYSAITYFMTEQPPELERFLKFALIYILTAVMADAFGTLLGTLINPVVS